MHKRFSIIPTSIPGLHIFERNLLVDDRGFLDRHFCRDELQQFLFGKSITQINRTLTTKPGTVRGMHFQYPPAAETKVVCCTHGEVFDVAVDIRRNSPSFLKWHGEILSANNHKTIIIPEGFAHGFQTLTNNCEMLYFHTATYQPDAEGGLNAKDPKLSIQWPHTFTEQSPRDLAFSMLTNSFTGILV